MVDHFFGDQKKIAAIDGGDGSEIGDLCGRLATKRHVTTTEKVRVAHIQSRSHKPGGIDPTARAYQNAIRVDQVDLAIGLEIAVKFRRRTRHHPVERSAVHSRLDEPRRLSGVDGKGVPVNDGPITALVNGRQPRTATDGSRSALHRGIGGIGRQRMRKQADAQKGDNQGETGFSIRERDAKIFSQSGIFPKNGAGIFSHSNSFRKTKQIPATGTEDEKRVRQERIGPRI